MTPLPHRLVTALLGVAACLTLNSCQSTGSDSGTDSSGIVDYTSPTSKMSKKEKENYAFDDSGKYREKWVAANAGGKVKDTSMSTDSPYVQDDIRSGGARYTPPKTSAAYTPPKTSAAYTPQKTSAAYTPPKTSAAYADTPVTSPAYADTPVTPRKSVASTSSGTRKSSSSGARKSTASNSSGSRKSTASSKSKKPAAKSTPKPTVVTIKPGDTLSSYSRKTGVPVETIKAYNGMKSDLLVDGKTIKIPPKKK